MLEAADLGVRLVQAQRALGLARCWLPVCAAVVLLALSHGRDRPLAARPARSVWLKPWLDRSLLFVLSRAVFGEPTRFADLWRGAAPRLVGALLRDADAAPAVALARRSRSRSYQLEGQRGAALRKRRTPCCCAASAARRWRCSRLRRPSSCARARHRSSLLVWLVPARAAIPVRARGAVPRRRAAPCGAGVRRAYAAGGAVSSRSSSPPASRCTSTGASSSRPGTSSRSSVVRSPELRARRRRCWPRRPLSVVGGRGCRRAAPPQRRAAAGRARPTRGRRSRPRPRRPRRPSACCASRPRRRQGCRAEAGAVCAGCSTCMRWLAEAGRWLVWLLGMAALAALLIVRLRRWMRCAATRRAAARSPCPATCASSTSGPKACPPIVRRRPRARCGNAASARPRCRCCTAARCRGWCTSMACRSRVEHRGRMRARWPRAISAPSAAPSSRA